MTIFDNEHEFAFFLAGLGLRTRQSLRKAGWPRELIYRDSEPSNILSLEAGDVVTDGKRFGERLTARTAAAYKTLELIARINVAIAAGDAPHELAGYCVMLGECRAVMILDGGVLDPRAANLRKGNATRHAKADEQLLVKFVNYREARAKSAPAASLEDIVERFARLKLRSKRHRKRIRELLAEGRISRL
jgi:hypothetical protein